MARLHPDAVAYRDLDAGGAITFSQWEAESNRLGRGLRTAGVAAGDRVALHIAMTEALRWIVAYAAIHKAGAVAVPTNTRLTARELAAIWGHAQVGTVITSDDALVVDGAARTFPTAAWAALLDDDPSEYQVPVEPDALADIMYTSGTTGLPKGVAVRHSNAATVPLTEPAWTGHGWLHSSPLFTFAGLSSVYNPMKLGMSGLFRPKFDAGQWLRDIEHERPGAAFIVPAMAQLIVAHPAFAGADLSSLWMCSIGSAPLAPETLRRMQEKMPNASVSNSYGMTEAGAAYCVMPKDEAGRRVGSVGKVMPPALVKVVRPDGDDAAADEVGEIWLKPPGRLREYYRDPEATAAMYAGGWVHTGDLGKLDGDGFLYISGRAKDVIIRGGNNIHPGDIEAVLFEHPAVRECAVVGVPHEVLGEDVAAFVVRNAEPPATAEELVAFCRGQLADYKVPRRIEFRTELPRNATGKVQKQVLRDELAGGTQPNR